MYSTLNRAKTPTHRSPCLEIAQNVTTYSLTSVHFAGNSWKFFGRKWPLTVFVAVEN